MEKEVEKIRISEITTLAGYNRGTFYEYFADRYELLEEQEDELIHKVTEIIQQIDVLSNGAHVISAIASVYESYGTHISLMLKRRGLHFSDRVRKILYPMFLNVLQVEDSYNARK